MNAALTIENRLIQLNKENKDYLEFIDQLIIKYPFASFLQLLRLKKIDPLNLPLNRENNKKIYTLFQQRNFLQLANYLENTQPIITENKIKIENTEVTKEESTKSLHFTNMVSDNNFCTADLEVIKTTTYSESNNKISLNNYINGIEIDDIPFVLETLINKYYSKNFSYPLNLINNGIEQENDSAPTIELDKKMSFQNWANLSNKIQKTAKKNNEKPNQNIIIEKFLKENPKISQPSENFQEKNIEFNSPEIYSIMTETLAEIYLHQNKFEKAMEAYSVLSLKFPEKNHYFANKINQIKKLI